jgi:predicted transposase/invertase (TIGR01784 family)
MSQLVENDPIIREAYQELQRFSSNPEMREKERRRQRFLADYNLSIGAAKRDGIIEGRSERDVEIARNMKKEGCDPEFISRMTGLSADEIAGLE